MKEKHRVIVVVALAAILGWATIDGPVYRSIRDTMAVWMGLVPYWARWAWRALAVVSGVAFALSVPRLWFLAAPATVLIDLPQLLYGGPGNLAGFVLGIRREWCVLVALGSVVGWVMARAVRRGER